MKKLVSFVCAIALVLPVSFVHAHVQEESGTVTARMHLKPAHKPTSTEPATFEFYMSDSARTFNPSAYTYTLEVMSHSLFATTTIQAESATLLANFIFPSEGEYAAILTGHSTQADLPSFTLDFDDITVLPVGQHENPITSFFGEHGGHALVIFLVILAFIGVVVEDLVIEPWIKQKWSKKS